MPRVQPGQLPACIDEDLIFQISDCDAGSCRVDEAVWVASEAFHNAVTNASFCAGFDPGSPCETPEKRTQTVNQTAKCLVDPGYDAWCGLLMGRAFVGAYEEDCPGITKETQERAAKLKSSTSMYMWLGGIGLGVVAVWWWKRKKN